MTFIIVLDFKFNSINQSLPSKSPLWQLMVITRAIDRWSLFDTFLFKLTFSRRLWNYGQCIDKARFTHVEKSPQKLTSTINNLSRFLRWITISFCYQLITDQNIEHFDIVLQKPNSRCPDRKGFALLGSLVYLYPIYHYYHYDLLFLKCEFQLPQTFFLWTLIAAKHSVAL